MCPPEAICLDFQVVLTKGSFPGWPRPLQIKFFAHRHLEVTRLKWLRYYLQFPWLDCPPDIPVSNYTVRSMKCSLLSCMLEVPSILGPDKTPRATTVEVRENYTAVTTSWERSGRSSSSELQSWPGCGPARQHRGATADATHSGVHRVLPQGY